MRCHDLDIYTTYVLYRNPLIFWRVTFYFISKVKLGVFRQRLSIYLGSSRPKKKDYYITIFQDLIKQNLTNEISLSLSNRDVDHQVCSRENEGKR